MSLNQIQGTVERLAYIVAYLLDLGRACKVEQSLNRGLHPLDLFENDVQVFLTEGLIGQRIDCRLDQAVSRR